MSVRDTKRVHSDADFDLHRFQVGRCDVCIFVSRHEPRVLIGGGEYGYDSLVRQADAVEVAALAERFNLPGLAEVARRMRGPD